MHRIAVSAVRWSLVALLWGDYASSAELLKKNVIYVITAFLINSTRQVPKFLVLFYFLIFYFIILFALILWEINIFTENRSLLAEVFVTRPISG